jgi:ATP-binding cassette subfamily F protein 3
MLTAHHLTKTFGVETLLDSISFSLNPGERMGLVGPNGCGKTTLLRILAGRDSPDSGVVQLNPPDLRVGYLPQGLDTERVETLGAFLARQTGNPAVLTTQLERLADALAHSPHQPDLLRDYDATLAHLSSAAANEARAPGLLAAFGLDSLPQDLPVAALSGGQKTRLALAGVLLGDPQLLLLDEPTNHLDIRMLEWLEDWLSEFRGAALLVSHDRAFLDRAVMRILEMDPMTHTAREYTGNYSDYVEEKLAERERQWGAWRDQQEEIRRMKQDIARTKEQSLSVERTTTPRQPGVRRIAKKVARKALAREKKLDRYLVSDERVEKPKLGWQMKLAFEHAPPSGQTVLVAEGLAVGYGAHILLRDLNLYLRRGARAVLIGPNGAGKTTLLRTVAGQLPPLGGRLRLGAKVRVGYMTQEQEGLDPTLDAYTTLARLVSFSETEVRSFLHYFLFEDDEVFLPVARLSFGERARLVLATLVVQGCNFLLLDEPINHLDIPSRARFEQALSSFEGTVLAVVHDRYFIQQFATEIWEVIDSAVMKQQV